MDARIRLFSNTSGSWNGGFHLPNLKFYFSKAAEIEHVALATLLNSSMIKNRPFSIPRPNWRLWKLRLIEVLNHKTKLRP